MNLSFSSIIATAIIVLSRTQVVQAWGAPSMAHVPGCESYTKLLPRYDLYSKHCESASGPSGSDPKWPCFTMWYSDMSIVNATLDGNSKVQPDDHFLIKNGDKLDFTTRDPAQPFTLSWYFGDVSMSYSDFDRTKGCFKISLQHKYDNDWRIWVSDEDGKGRDIDTEHHRQTDKVLCTKWLHIHVKQDGQ